MTLLLELIHAGAVGRNAALVVEAAIALGCLLVVGGLWLKDKLA